MKLEIKQIETSKFNFLRAYTMQPTLVTNSVQNQVNKINTEIEKYTKGLPEDEKTYVIEALTLASYAEITIETALTRIELSFGESARVNAEGLYAAAIATW